IRVPSPPRGCRDAPRAACGSPSRPAPARRETAARSAWAWSKIDRWACSLHTSGRRCVPDTTTQWTGGSTRKPSGTRLVASITSLMSSLARPRDEVVHVRRLAGTAREALRAVEAPSLLELDDRPAHALERHALGAEEEAGSVATRTPLASRGRVSASRFDAGGPGGR